MIWGREAIKETAEIPDRWVLQVSVDRADTMALQALQAVWVRLAQREKKVPLEMLDLLEKWGLQESKA